MTPTSFISDLAGVRLQSVFNPYSERCAVYDLSDGPDRRRANLLAVLNVAVSGHVGSLWIGRDLGYRGGRRTGLPLTDEIHLAVFSRIWGGLPLRRATSGPAMAERTATIVWEMLDQINEPVFLWNLFPFHPHEPNEPLTNRAHTRPERRVGEEFLALLLEMIRPSRLVAIGGDASQTLDRMEIRHVRVRHPSYGGQQDFCDGIQALYGLSTRKDEGNTLRLL